MRRLIAAVTVAAAFAALPAHAADPSQACDSGIVPTSSTPAGLGARLSTEPMKVTATGCVASMPLPGHAKATADASAPSVTVVVDGDPSATMLGCTDGYTGAKADSSGLSLYHAPDGGFTSRARAKSPAEIADAALKYCTPPASV